MWLYHINLLFNPPLPPVSFVYKKIHWWARTEAGKLNCKIDFPPFVSISIYRKEHNKHAHVCVCQYLCVFFSSPSSSSFINFPKSHGEKRTKEVKMKESSRQACGSQRYVVIFPTGPSNSLGFRADAGWSIACKSFLLPFCNKWEVWEWSLAKVAWFWVAFAFLKIPAPLSFIYFFSRSRLISHHLLPGVPGESDLWTQLQEAFGFFLPLYLLFPNPRIDVYLGKGQRTIFSPSCSSLETQTPPLTSRASECPQKEFEHFQDKWAQNSPVKTKEGPPALSCVALRASKGYTCHCLFNNGLWWYLAVAREEPTDWSALLRPRMRDGQLSPGLQCFSKRLVWDSSGLCRLDFFFFFFFHFFKNLPSVAWNLEKRQCPWQWNNLWDGVLRVWRHKCRSPCCPPGNFTSLTLVLAQLESCPLGFTKLCVFPEFSCYGWNCFILFKVSVML